MDGGFVGEVNRGRHRNAWAWDMQRGGRRAYKDVEVAGVDAEPKKAGVPVVLATEEWVEIHEGPVIASDGPVVEVVEHLPEPEQTPTVTSGQHRPKTESEDGSSPHHSQYAYGSPWPSWVKEFRENQVQALEDVRKAYGQGADVVFLDAPTGCLAGSTQIGINRGGKGYTISLKDLVHSSQGGLSRGHKWNLDIPTNIQRNEDGIMRLGRMATAFESGVKKTYTLITQSGKSIRATITHPFLTPEGFRQLHQLNAGDVVMVLGSQKGDMPRQPKLQYRHIQGLRGHPYATLRREHPKVNYRVPAHRVIVEADLNGMTLEHFVSCLRVGERDFHFLSPEEEVHHIDHNTFNNDLDNLEVKTSLEHHRDHAIEYKHRHVAHKIIEDVITSIEPNAGHEMTYDITMADAPHNFIANGFVVHNSGKTLMGEAIRRELQVNGLYVCSGKTLQDQFVRDFPYSAVIKGRSNYIPTHAGDEWGVEVTCADCDKRRVDEIEWECSHCEEVNDCPYGIAKGMAAISEVAVANTTYMLHEANYTRGGLCSGREFVVVDEADVLEKELMRFVEFSIGKHQVAQLGVQPPKKGSHTTTIVKWIEDDLTEAITKKLEGLRGSPRDVRIRRRKEAYETMRGRAKQVAQEMREYDSGWVRDNDAGPLVMKPVDVAWAAPNLLWKHSQKWMLMSATIISAEEMVESLGIEQAGEDGKGLTWDVVEVPMSFPVENRRIHAIPMANMVAKEKATAWPQMGDALCRVVDRHPRERILVHCVSFELGRSLSGRLLGHLSHHRDNQMFDTENNPTSSVEGERAHVGDRTVITYGSGQGERDQAVAKFRSQEGAILIAPSLDRGVDLREDDCRVVVVCKVPFPYLGDKQVAARANAGRKGRMWYAVQTVRTLVQMTGRHVRSEEDWGVTYILDKQFVDNIYSRNKVLFPRWWRKAVKVESRRWLEDGNG